MNSRLQTQIKTAWSPSFIPTQKGLLQRKYVSDGCDKCSKKRLILQRRSINITEPSKVPPIVHEVLRSPGQPLDPNTREYMEPRFGHDFSQVRVHTDAKAEESARAVNALAYTVGRDVVFGTGQYALDMAGMSRLLAHELVHVVQQSKTPGAGPLAFDHPVSPAECEADKVANGLNKVRVAETAQASVQRQPDDTKPHNVGPPLQELPLPPRCSIIWKDGKWSWKCEGIPKIGSTPDIPLDPRDIPGRIKDLLPKGSGGEPGGGQRTFPVPPTPGSDLPPNWLEDVCRRNPMSPLCIPLGKEKSPDQPKSADILARPIGVFWTTDVLFEHDQPSPKEGAPNGGMTADGTKAINTIVFLLNSDPTLQVRLIGHASSEGDTAHNLELSKRRARLVYQKLDEAKLGGRVINPIEPDGKSEGCRRLEPGVWACGELRATPKETRPEERKVEVTFLRNPPLPSGPFKLTLPRFGRPRTE